MDCKLQQFFGFKLKSIIIFFLFFSGNRIVSVLLCILVITINIIFVVDQVNSAELVTGYVALVVIVGICYIIFNCYLVIHMMASMGNEWLNNNLVS